MKKAISAILGSLVITSLVLSGCGSTQPASQSASAPAGKGEVKIGMVTAMSGGGAIYGQQMQQAAQLAVDEINKAGGVNGMQFKLLVEDDKSSPQDSVTATQKLVSQDNINVWMGTLNSSNTLADLEITKQTGLPSLVPIAAAEKITQLGYKNVFRNCADNSMQVKDLADYILKQRPERKFTVIAENTDYGKSLADNFQKDITSGGGSVIDTEYYKPGDKDFYNQLTKIKGLNPEGLVVAGLIAEGSQIVKQAHELGIKAQLYSFGGFMGADAVKLAGDAAEGLIHTDYFSPVKGDPVIDKFVNAYQARYGVVPDSYYSAAVYDAIYIVKAAIEKAGSTDPDKVDQALAQTKDFPGVMGKTTFDSNGQAQLKVSIAQIKGGKQTVIYKP